MSNAEDGLIVKLGRTVALAGALLLAAGCGGGGGSSPAPAAPGAPAPTPTPVPALFPAGSSAASYILANVNPSQTSVSRQAPTDQDDGGWSQLQLPPLQPCGNGALATDCRVWIFAAAGSSAARRPRTPIVGSHPPTFNFCRDAAAYPGDLGRSAIPITGLSGQSFSLAYSGTKALPVVAFATRWWTVGLANTFAGNATIAPSISVTPALSDTAARGWLLFFTWSWPADVLAIPFQINEVQLSATSSPLAIPPGSSGTLGAFDCVGRPLTATAPSGSGFGFSPDLSTTGVTSPGAELNVPLYTGPAPSGSAILYDDRGAVTATPVT